MGSFGEVLAQYARAFIVGGAFCVIAQVLIDKTRLTPARILVAYVVSGVLLTGIGVYKPIVDLAGAGATVPLTGFGFCLASGVKKAVDEIGLMGAFTGGLTATSAGITAAMTFGLLASVIFRSRSKAK